MLQSLTVKQYKAMFLLPLIFWLACIFAIPLPNLVRPYLTDVSPYQFSIRVSLSSSISYTFAGFYGGLSWFGRRAVIKNFQTLWALAGSHPKSQSVHLFQTMRSSLKSQWVFVIKKYEADTSHGNFKWRRFILP